MAEQNEIVINVSTNAAKAAGQLDKLSQSVKGLGNSLSGTNYNSINGAMKSLTESLSKGIDMRVIGKIQRIGESVKNVTGFMRSAATLSKTNMGAFSDNLTTAVSAIPALGEALYGVDTTRFRDIGAGLSALSRMGEKIDGRTLNANVAKITNAMSSFSKNTPEFSTGVKDSISSISRLVSALSKLSQIDAIDLKSFNSMLDDVKNFSTDLGGVSSGLSGFVKSFPRIPMALVKFTDSMPTLVYSLESIKRYKDVDFTNLSKSVSGVINAFSAVDADSDKLVALVRVSEVYKNAASAIKSYISAVKSEQKVLGKNLGGADISTSLGAVSNESKIDEIIPWYKKLGDTVNRAFVGSGKAVTKFGAVTASVLNGVKKSVTNGFLSRIILRRLIFSAIRLITSSVGEGIGNVYSYAEQKSLEFASTMDTAATATNYLKNSIGAGLSQALTTVIPYFDAVISKIADFMNSIANMYAALTGKSTYTAAVKRLTKYGEETEANGSNLSNYANSISEYNKKIADSAKEQAESARTASEDALKAAKATILGFDELNVLNGDETYSKDNSYSAPNALASVPYMTMSDIFDFDTTKLGMFEERLAMPVAEARENMDKILSIVGTIGSLLLGWKLSKSAESAVSLLTKNGLLAQGTTFGLEKQIALALSVVGVTLSFSGAKAIGYGDADFGDWLKTILGDALGIGGLAIAFGGAGAVVGIVISIAATIAGIKVGQKQAKKDYIAQLKSNSATSKAIQRINDAVSDVVSESMNITASIKDIQMSAASLGELDYAQRILDSIFKIEKKDNKTAAEMETLTALVSHFNSLGLGDIQLEFDTTTGHIANSRIQVQGLMDDLRKQYELEAKREIYIELLKKQYEAEQNLKNANELVASATGNYHRAQLGLYNFLNSDALKTLYEQRDALSKDRDAVVNCTGAYSNLTVGTTAWEQALETANGKVNANKAAIDAILKSGDYEFYKQQVDEARKSQEEAEKALGIANKTYISATQSVNNYANSLGTATSSYKTLINTTGSGYTARINFTVGMPTPAEIDSLVKSFGSKLKALEIAAKIILPSPASVAGAFDKYNGLGTTAARQTTRIEVKGAGGFVSTGDLFIANEAGPELISTSGGRTKVTNQDQFARGMKESNKDVVSAVYDMANRIIRAIEDNPSSTVITTGDIASAMTRASRRDGKTVALS